MSTVEIKRDQPGNTNIPVDKTRKPQTHPLFVWCFTLTIEIDQIDPEKHKVFWDHLLSFCKKFTFQLEKGSKTGYEHYQGVFSLQHKERFETVKNLLGDKAHIEPCKNYNASVKYCSKEDTRIAGPWNENSSWVSCPPLNKGWQWELRSMLLKDPHYRTIYWIWEEMGGVGKTAFAKHMAIMTKALVVTSGSSKDVSYMIKHDTKIIIFDFPRTQMERVNYGLIECLKNGLITSAKYETCTKVFNSPHIVCFANSPPNIESMSKDRWVIYKIVNDMLIEDNTDYSLDSNIYNAALNPPGASQGAPLLPL